MSTLKTLWHDETGSADAMYTVLFLTICAIGIIPGLVSIRDQIVQHFGDTAVALDQLDQSYSFTVGTVTSSYADPAPTLTDPANDEPAGIDLQFPASPE